MAIPYTVEIIQQSAPARGVVLKGGSLPLKGTFVVSGEQRTNIEWMPGSPVAIAQVTGPMESPTTMSGVFRDTMVAKDESAATLFNFPAISISAQPGADQAGGLVGGSIFRGSTPVPQQQARTALAIVAALDLLRQEGAICKMTWGPIVRYGFVGLFTFTPDMSSDIPWELEFRVTGLSLSQPKPRVSSLSLPSLLRQLLAAIDALLDKVRSVLAKANAWITKIEAGIDRVVSLMLELSDLLRQVIDTVDAPLDLLQRLRSSLQSVVVAAKDVAFTAQQAIPSVQVATAKASGDPVDVADATIDANELRDLLVRAGVEAATRSIEIEQLIAASLLAVIVAERTMSLQKIAGRFYGDASQWTEIRDFNFLTSSLVPRGTVVRVPRLS